MQLVRWGDDGDILSNTFDDAFDTVGMLLLINVGRGSWQGGAYVGCTKHLEVGGKK